MYQLAAFIFCFSLWSCHLQESGETKLAESEGQSVETSLATDDSKEEKTEAGEQVVKLAEVPDKDLVSSKRSEGKFSPSSHSPDQPVSTTTTDSSAPVVEEETALHEREETPHPSLATPTSEPDLPGEEAQPQLTRPDHSIWDGLLQQYVRSNGTVNYAGLKSQQGQLQSYLDELSQYPPQSDWSRQEAMAYWINAYNAFTIQLILDHLPVQSIRDIAGGQPWDKKWIRLGDSTYSLDQIENDILRPRYQDARIHFAVNCAARSCPPLHNRAFTAANLDRTLEQLTRQFINNSTFNSIKEDQIDISKIFDWYGGDFGDLRAYLNRYTTVRISGDAEIRFKAYNWALNN